MEIPPPTTILYGRETELEQIALHLDEPDHRLVTPDIGTDFTLVEFREVPATPTMTDSPQPLWQHSSADRMSSTLPTHSKE